MLKIDIPNLVEVEKLYIVMVEGNEFEKYGITDKDRLMVCPDNAISELDKFYLVKIGETCTIRPPNNIEGDIQGKILRVIPPPRDIKFRG